VRKQKNDKCGGSREGYEDFGELISLFFGMGDKNT